MESLKQGPKEPRPCWNATARSRPRQRPNRRRRELATTAGQRRALLLKALAGFAALLVAVVVLLLASRRGLEESRSATQLAASDAVIRAYADKDPTAAALAYEALARDQRTQDSVRTARFALLNGQMAWRELPHPAPVSKVAFSPDGSWVATAAGSKIRLWTLDGRLVREIVRHSARITTLEFSHDSTRILTASTDRTARVFSLDGDELAFFSGHGSVVYKAFFFVDDRNSDRGQRWGPAVADERHGPTPTFGAHLSDAAISPDGQFAVTTTEGVWSRSGDRGRLL